MTLRQVSAPKCGRWFLRSAGRSDREYCSHACQMRGFWSPHQNPLSVTFRMSPVSPVFGSLSPGFSPAPDRVQARMVGPSSVDAYMWTGAEGIAAPSGGARVWVCLMLRRQCLMNAQCASRITSAVANRRARPIPLSVIGAEYKRSLAR